MKFQVLTIVHHSPHPLTGELLSAADRLEQVVTLGETAERLGFDAYAVGERHAGPFLSSAPTVLLAALAARTTRIRLLTGVTVVAILDPVRVAEDYATLDQLSRGRIELVVGKGAEAGHFDLFGLDEERQWDLQKEKYELLRRLWTEEGVDWEGEFRPALKNVTTVPRPYAGPPRVWHGSATSLNSPSSRRSTATRSSPPTRSSPARRTRGSSPTTARSSRSTGTTRPTRAWRPVPAACSSPTPPSRRSPATRACTRRRSGRASGRTWRGRPATTPFRTIEDAVADGPQLIGSPQQIIDKILGYHEHYGHDLQSVTVDAFGQSTAEQAETLQRFAEEIAPVVRREAPSTLWEE